MVGLHVQLDVEYWMDQKLVGVGSYAELLYVRSLCFSKRTMLDGRITWNQLAAIAHGIPTHRKHADLLIASGAFTATSDGVYVTGWLKRNKTAARIKAESARKSREALERNHNRWHVEENKPNASCVLCYPDDDRPPNSQSTDQNTNRNTDQWSDGAAGTSLTTTEVETETQPEEESESESSSSTVTQLKLVPAPPADDDDRFTQTVDIVLRAKENDTQPHSPGGWRITVRADIHATHGNEIRRLLALDLEPVAIAATILESKSAALYAASQLGLTA
jgi:hypothetical protein